MTYPVVYLRQPDRDDLEKFSFGKLHKLSVGRDASCDIHIDQAHVSSFHLELVLDMFNEMVCVDTSTNGTFIGVERLPSEMPHLLGTHLTILDLRMNVELGICHTLEHEIAYLRHVGGGTIPSNLAHFVDQHTPGITIQDTVEDQEPALTSLDSSRQPTRVISMNPWSPQASYQRKRSSSNTILGVVVVLLGLAYLGIIFGKQIAQFLSHR